MAVFRYVAYDALGARRRGHVEGDSARDARDKLRAMRLRVARVSPVGAGQRAGFRRRLAGILYWGRASALAMPLRELSTLLSAGVPLTQALGALAAQAETSDVRHVFHGLRERVEAGTPFSQAVEEQPWHFDAVARNMIAAGEAGGNLETAVLRLSERMQRHQELAARVSSALVYPAILLAVSLAVVVFLLTYVVPRVACVYLQLKAELPVATRVLMAVSGFVTAWWWALLLLLLCMVAAWRLVLRHERVSLRWDRAKVRWPFLGALYRKRCVAELAATLGSLLEAGIPLVPALRVTAGTLPNRAAAHEVRRVADEVETGQAMAGAVRRTEFFPPTLSEVVAAGEESGELIALLKALSEDYGRQVEVAADRACRALEPLIVVAMGGVVLFIVLAVLLPIIRVAQLIHV